ncbi:hypothetical protein PIB30_026271 [Stylosanthes scabra]|uniref:Uncharacterized protein n=1 Tax=Stylosanthes scabra TaxID=79078 RepID=A0ABU6TC42_9FABA|nr:hypothetical protein [Stylosanthes scabra]
MAEEDSFLALVHHDGEIKHSSQEGVKFTRKIQPMCSTRRERVCRIFSVASNGRSVLTAGSEPVPEVRTTELFVEMFAPLASTGGSAPGQHSANVVGPSRRAIRAEPEAQLVASLTFKIYNEAEAGDLVADLGDTGTGASQALCTPPVQRVPDPGVVEAL